MIICFMGIDGSGKTTYSSKLYKELKNKGYECSYIHFDSVFSNKLLEILFKFTKNSKQKQKSIKTSKINSRSQNSKIKAYLWPIIIFIDVFVFYLINFKIKEVNKIIICDRYFFDSLVTSIYYGASESIFYRIYKLFPSPDVLFLMDLEPDIAYKRKFEDSLNYLTLKRKIYLNLYNILDMKKLKINSSNKFIDTFNSIKHFIKPILYE